MRYRKLDSNDVSKNCLRGSTLLLCTLLILKVTTLSSSAAATGLTRVWTGAGGNGAWSNPTNWAGTILEAPVSGDSLRFPVFESNRVTTNDFPPGFVVDRIIINGTNVPSRYSFHGNRVDLLNGISSISQNSLSHQFFCPVSLLAPQTFGADRNGGLQFLASVDNNGFLLVTTNDGTSTLTFNGPIVGAGGLTHSGSNGPAINLTGTNTFTGPCTVAAGRLDAANAFALGAASSDLLVGASASLVLQSGFTLTKSSLSLTGTFSSAFTNTFNGEVRLFGAAPTFTGNPQTRTTLNGPVVGASQMTKSGAGVLELPGANTYSGGTFLGSGTLLVNGTTPFGTLSIGGSSTLAGTGVVGNVAMTTGSAPKLAPGASAGLLTVSNITFRDSGEFIVELNGAAPGTGYDQLIVRGVVDLANADLRWSLGFAPTFGDVMKIIDNDGADAVVGIFDGLPEGALVTTNGVSLRVSYIGGDGNDVTLTRALIGTGVTRIWDAGGANNFWSNPTNWTGDVVPVTGDTILFPSNLSVSDAQTTNDLLAGTIFDQLIVRNGSGGIGTVLHGNAIGLINGMLGTNTADSFRMQLPLQLTGPQSFMLSAAGYTFGAPITLNGNLTLGGGSIIITGAVVGVGGIIKTNGGSFILNASNSFNGPVQILSGVLNLGHPSALGLPGGGTFIGAGVSLILGHTGTLAENFLSITGSVSVQATNVIQGQIELPGTFTPFNCSPSTRLTLSGLLTGAGSPLFLGGGSFVLSGTNACTSESRIENGTLLLHGRSSAGDLNVSPATAILGGTGVVGRLTVQNNGTINPGASPGVLSSSNLFAANSSTLLFELNGPTVGTGYDQLNVTGTVFLGGGSLVLSLGFTPPVGTVFVIINNDAADAVGGTFGGLPEGATFTTNSVNVRVSYIGGDGNDVTLTRFIPPTGITRVWDGEGVTGFWSNPFNWVGDVAPVQGDTLAFPVVASRKVNTNDFASDTFFNAIQFSGNGYTLRGSPVVIGAGVVGSNALGVNFVNFDVAFGAGSTVAQHGGAGLIFSDDVSLPATLTTFGSGSVNFSGPVSGVGGIVMQGPGFVVLNTANSYSGTTEIQTGRLDIGSSSSLGSTAAGTTVRAGATLAMSAEVTIAEPLSLAGVLNNSADSNEWSGPIALDGAGVQIVIDDQTLTLSGVISGTNGFIKRGTEILRLTNTNSYSGATRIGEGKLLVDGSHSLSSQVLLEGGTMGGVGRLGTITSVSGGIVAPGASPGRLTASTVVWNPATTFSIELNGTAAGTNYDQLFVFHDPNLGGATLSISLGFAPAIGDSFKIIDNADNPVFGTFAGLPEGALLTNGAVVFRISYVGGNDNHDVTLTRIAVPTGVTRVWDGGGVGNLWSTPANWVGDVVPQEGDNVVFPAGVSKNPQFNAGTNVTFNTLLFGSDYTMTVAAGHSLRLLNGLTATNTFGIVNIFVPITLANDQIWNLTHANRLVQAQRIDLGTATLTHAGAGDLGILDAITGSGGLIGNSPGGLFLDGTNTFTGTMSIHAGVLTVLRPEAFGSPLGGTFIDTNAALSLELPHAAVVNEPLTLVGRIQFFIGRTNAWNGPIVLSGAQAAFESFTSSRLDINGPVSGTGFQSLGIGTTVLNGAGSFAGPVRVAGGSRLLVNSSHAGINFVLTNTAILGGTGVVGQVSATGCIACEVQPGPLDQPGLLRSSNVNFGANARLRAQLNGVSAGTGYDQLDVTGTIALTNASLVVTAGFSGIGLTFTLINNDGADPIAGIFQNLPQNALLTNNGFIFRINYTGGDGNDVTLTGTLDAPPSTIQFSGINSNGLFTLSGSGFSNAPYFIEATTNLAPPIAWQNLALRFSNSNGVYQFIDPDSTNFPIRFYRVRSP